MRERTVLIVGAGFSGSVIARELADAGISSLVIDRRPHVAGNCHTERAEDCGVLEHCYGPHIFHTSDLDTWQYIQRFGEIVPFTHRVKSSTTRGFFDLPINLNTINQFFDKNLNPHEAEIFIKDQADHSIVIPKNFEEQALKSIGRELYENFFYGYTRKQWGCEPRELPTSIFRRIPLRFNCNENYYLDTYCGIPREGYTNIVEGILNHSLIRVELNQSYDSLMRDRYNHIFYSGPIDTFYEHRFGRLGYRSVFWEREVVKGQYQEHAQINFPEIKYPFTRKHEHKYFAPWEKHEYSSFFTEYSKETGPSDEPAYPKRLSDDLKMFSKYQVLADQEECITFIGRLGTYRYLDMHMAIWEARLAAKNYLSRRYKVA